MYTQPLSSPFHCRQHLSRLFLMFFPTRSLWVIAFSTTKTTHAISFCQVIPHLSLNNRPSLHLPSLRLSPSPVPYNYLLTPSHPSFPPPPGDTQKKRKKAADSILVNVRIDLFSLPFCKNWKREKIYIIPMSPLKLHAIFLFICDTYFHLHKVNII